MINNHYSGPVARDHGGHVQGQVKYRSATSLPSRLRMERISVWTEGLRLRHLLAQLQLPRQPGSRYGKGENLEGGGGWGKEETTADGKKV